MSDLSRVVGAEVQGAPFAEAPALGGDRAARVRVETIAGDGTEGFADGHGPAARFCAPTGLCVGPSGVIIVADSKNHSIRRITRG